MSIRKGVKGINRCKFQDTRFKQRQKQYGTRMNADDADKKEEAVLISMNIQHESAGINRNKGDEPF